MGLNGERGPGTEDRGSLDSSFQSSGNRSPGPRFPAPCPRFVELRCHTAFSFGDGGVAPEVLAKHAAGLGYATLGITDHADLGGIVRFAAACGEHGVRPIVGAELVVDGRPLALIARTLQGYRNLAALITSSRVGNLRRWTKRTATRGRLRLSWAEVAERNEGLHLLTGPASGTLATLVRANQLDDARRLLVRYRDLFGERLAVEVQLHHAGRDEAALAGSLVELAGRAAVPWVVTNDPRYIDEGTRLVHEILTALRHGTDLVTATERGLLHPNGSWQLLSPETMAEQWRGAEAGLAESQRIASECEFDLSWVRPPLPRFNVPYGYDDVSFLREQVYYGAAERWGAPGEREKAQIEHELAVIDRLGFSGFFLVMWDAVRFARSQRILCQGRGSAANSVVAYCLGVTAVDPVKHGLLFERFLSEARIDGLTDAPDIDVDVEHDRREEVLDYMYHRYQRSSSALTCVTQLYSACTALQDSMRALGYPAETAFKLSKRLHGYGCSPGADYLERELATKQGVDLSDERGKTVLAAIRAFDDMPRLRSTHPGGFVLSSEPLGDFCPIEATSMGRTIIQFDKDDLDLAGIPKFDFLGLGGLSLVRRAFEAIEARTGTVLSMYNLPDDDPTTYTMISKGETIGTFQIESRAQIASILHTKPERLYDLVVQVALIRPGPIQAKFVNPYTQRRRGHEEVTYLHPALEPILKRTQGIPIFQEQAMAIAMTLAGYSAVEADLLRRTMGNQRKMKRLVVALATLRERFIANGISDEVAHQIEDDLLSFANYGFPESHAWSFALIAFATAYLKANYPTEFLFGLLNAQPLGFYPIATLIHDSRRSGVLVDPPCLLEGERGCTIEGGKTARRQGGKLLRWKAKPGNLRRSLSSQESETALPPSPRLRLGWRFIRGIGGKALDALEKARKDGPFSSIADVIRRTELPRTDVLSLARAGAFAAWEPNRRKAAWEGLRHSGDTLPLAPPRPTPHAPRAFSKPELVFLDYFSTGMSLNGHPVEHLRPRLGRSGAIDSRQLAHARHGDQVIVGGLVVARQRPESANGVLFILLEDEYGFLNAIVRREVEEAHREISRHSSFLLILGHIQRDGPVVQVIAERLKPIMPRAALTFKARDFR
ncbi:MAG: error-prone DNA polymerase [Gemmatimonadota bacterium]